MRIVEVALLLAASSCGTKAHHEPQTFQVEIRGMHYAPATLPVAVGDHVVWTNRDVVPHTVTADGWFDSGSLSPNQQWSYTIGQPVVFDYRCTFHPTMKAQLTPK